MTEKDKKTAIILVVLIAVAVFVFLPNPKDKKRRTAAPAAVSSSTNTAELKLADDFDKKKLIDLVTDDKNDSKVSFNQEWGERNPFDVSPLKALSVVKPEVKVVSTEKPLVLMGVLWGGRKPSVIINDKVVGVGDVIEGWTVKEIGESRVALTNGLNEKTLTMWQ